MSPKKKLEFLKDIRFWVVVGAVVLMILLFLVGPKIGLGGEKRLLAIIAVLLLAMILLLVFKGSSKKKDADDIEKSLILEADSMIVTSSGAQRKASEEAREELMRAIEGLKKSTVAGGRGGNAALSVLPWYLVLGRGQSGRSSVVRGSGLSIPGAAAGEKKKGRGVGATRHCEWWFTNQAILLEANGRFVSIDDDSSAQSDWKEFLQVLGKARPKLPLNGVLLTVSAEDLIRHDTNKLDDAARVLRSRLDSLESTLGVICPVYLLITKADLIHGFSHFFSDLDPKGRGQIWGATLTPDLAEGDDWGRAFRREFELLFRVLCKRRIARMDGEQTAQKRGEIYLFPLEFAALRKKLQRFVKTLFEANAYGANPLFRGFYFASADRGGVPVEMVVNEVSRVIGLPAQWEDDDVTRVLSAAPPPAKAGFAESSKVVQESTADPYFLRDLFARILLPDAGVARPTSRAAKKRELHQLLLQGAAGLGVLLLAAGLITSFIRNQSLVRRGTALAQNAALVTAPQSPSELEARLRSLDELRVYLEDLDKKEKRHPLTFSFGLFRGKGINRSARSIYLDRLVDVLLGPSRSGLESRLFTSYPASPEEYAKYFQDYRAYLMLIEPERAEAPFLAEHLGSIWAGGAGGSASEGLRGMTKQHVLYAWNHAPDITYHSAELPGRNPAVMERAAVYIREFWRPENYYLAMIKEVSDKVPAFTVGSIPGAEQLLTTNREALALDPDVAYVPGAFTLKGWQEEMRDRIEHSEERLANDWILKEAFQGQSANLRAWLVETYRKDYRARWNRFLAATDVIAPDGVGVAATRVHDLADRASPLLRLLDAAAANLRLRSASPKDGVPAELAALEDDFGALHSLFVMQGEGDEAKRPIDAYLVQLGAVLETLRQRQESGDVGSSSVQYAKGIMAGTSTDKNPIAESCAFADRHATALEGANSDCTLAVRTLLKRVPEAGWAGILADAQRMLDVAWGNDIWTPFHDTLAGKYPFQSGASDAAPAEFTRFFGPGGSFWNFYDADLAPFLDRDGNARVLFGHGLRVSAEAAEAIRRAQDFRRALFASESEAGKLGFTFRVKPSQTAKVSGQAPYVRNSRLTIGETRIVYDMGLARETKVPWPGPEAVEGASVAVTMDGNEPGTVQFEGPWALFRLVEKGRIAAQTDTECVVRWRLERAGEYAIDVPYEFRASTVPHPFREGFFDFRCPRQLSPGAEVTSASTSTG